MKGSNVKNLASIIERFPQGTKYRSGLFDMETRRSGRFESLLSSGYPARVSRPSTCRSRRPPLRQRRIARIPVVPRLDQLRDDPARG